MNRRNLRRAGAFGALGLVGSPPARAAGRLHVPDEAKPHARTFMQWPVSTRVYSDAAFLGDLQSALARVANAVAAFEPVVMLMDKRFERAARRKLGRAVEIWDVPTQDLWCRDSGPLFAIDGDGRLVVSHIRFNGWGGKQTYVLDARIAERVAALVGAPAIASNLVGEAGGVESDGEGTLIAHESCWINPNRNSDSKSEITQRLLAAYGARTMIWAPGVKGADITDYHIDALARFAGPGVVLVQTPDRIDPRDPWSRSAFETRDILAAARDANGRALVIERLPEPRRPRVTSRDFVAAYANYYVCNGAVIAAQFGDAETDAQARAVLARHYPGREIVALDVDAIGEVGGGIHCATQQQPAV